MQCSFIYLNDFRMWSKVTCIICSFKGVFIIQFFLLKCFNFALFPHNDNLRKVLYHKNLIQNCNLRIELNICKLWGAIFINLILCSLFWLIFCCQVMAALSTFFTIILRVEKHLRILHILKFWVPYLKEKSFFLSAY